MNDACRAEVNVARLLLLTLLLLLTCSSKGFAQDIDLADQVSINIKVQQIGSVDILALIVNEHAYLPVKELFDFLQIKNIVSEDFTTIHGSVIDPKAVFEINQLKSSIIYKGKTFTLKPADLIRTEAGIYLKTEFYGQIFGLNCLFKFHSLSIILTTTLELPAIRDMKLTQMRKNINSLYGKNKVDTSVKNEYPVFDFGVADWSVTATQDNKGNSNTRVNLVVGGIVGGGQAIANLNYNTSRSFNRKDQYYQWRYVNNEQPAVKQITAGRIFTQSISTLYNPVNGIQLSNAPTTYRKSFGSYRINDTTEPGWLVELYVNDILVNYVTADASGFYSFEVPIVYGNSAIKTRFYGPWGEERIQEQNVNIPFNFLPAGEFEYTLSTGIVNNSEKDILIRAAFSYGVNNYITIGGGTEHLSGINAGNLMPFVNSSVRLIRGLLVTGQYTQGINTKGILNYQLPGNLQLNVNYTRYAKEQTAILYSYLEERKIELSIPIRGKSFNAYARLSFNELVMPKSKVSNAQFMTSAVIAGIGTNFSTSALYTDPSDPYIYSNLSLTFRLPMNLRFSPHIQYEYKKKYVSTMKGELEKRIGSFGFANIGYEKNILHNISTINLGLRLNLSFAQTSFSVTQGHHSTSFSQAAFGSLLYNSTQHSLSLTNESNIGKGGLKILAFLDLNRNGRRDSAEPRALGLRIKINGGKLTRNDSDSTINVKGLEAYTTYIIQVDANSLDNISWRLKNKLIGVTIEPNHYKSVEIPISVVAEASGNVYMNQEGSQTTLTGMIVEFYNSKSVMVAKTLTESDGYFSFMDLPPGKYTARLNDTQLQVLQLKSTAPLPFEVKMSKDGDIIDGLNFILQKASIIKN